MKTELRTDIFFNARVEWMLVSVSLVFYLACLEKSVFVLGEGRAECTASAFGPECVYSLDYALKVLRTDQLFLFSLFFCLAWDICAAVVVEDK